jgi:2-iminobutanoate/2-iminopropanoate deaminase
VAKATNPSGIWKPFGAFSQAVVIGQGHLVYFKGQVSLDGDGEIVGEGRMDTQVDQVLGNIRNLLASFGGRMSDIVSLDQRTTDIKAFMECGNTRLRYFSEPYPVTTTVEVSALYDPRLLIEITTIAEIPVERFKTTATQVELHG